MRNSLCALTLGLIFLAPLAPPAQALTEDEAHALGVNAYLYFYPLVTMDITRLQLTNQQPGPGVARRSDESLCQYRGVSQPPTCAWWCGRISTRFIPAAGSI